MPLRCLGVAQTPGGLHFQCCSAIVRHGHLVLALHTCLMHQRSTLHHRTTSSPHKENGLKKVNTVISSNNGLSFCIHVRYILTCYVISLCHTTCICADLEPCLAGSNWMWHCRATSIGVLASLAIHPSQARQALRPSPTSSRPARVPTLPSQLAATPPKSPPLCPPRGYLRCRFSRGRDRR